jgi:hypothetical protein
MLTQLGLVVTGSTVESVFNDVWANNGDTISLCYAHTSALKGDFVRTGKRDLHGMLHDGVSSLSRMFYGAVSDFFAQAVISFFLGHRNLGVFSEFLQNLQSSDASSLIQLSRVRSAASESIDLGRADDSRDKFCSSVGRRRTEDCWMDAFVARGQEHQTQSQARGEGPATRMPSFRTPSLC